MRIWARRRRVVEHETDPQHPIECWGSSATAPFRHQRQTQPLCRGASESDAAWPKAKRLSSGVSGWSASSSPFFSVMDLRPHTERRPTKHPKLAPSAALILGANGRPAATAKRSFDWQWRIIERARVDHKRDPQPEQSLRFADAAASHATEHSRVELRSARRENSSDGPAN